jgi:hypothetical protein
MPAFGDAKIVKKTQIKKERGYTRTTAGLSIKCNRIIYGEGKYLNLPSGVYAVNASVITKLKITDGYCTTGTDEYGWATKKYVNCDNCLNGLLGWWCGTTDSGMHYNILNHIPGTNSFCGGYITASIALNNRTDPLTVRCFRQL